jgi:hypothetical protein
MLDQRRNLLLVLPLILIGSAAAAQSAEPLFVVRGAASATGQQDTVGMRLDRLFATTTDRVLLNIANHEWVAKFDRMDHDALGHRVWVGHIEDVDHSHVSFAERDGVVSGLVNAFSDVYQVRTVTPGSYLLERANPATEHGELNPLIDTGNMGADVAAPASTEAPADERGTIDILLLYTPRAVTRVGGNAQIRALAAQIISDSNTIFVRSGITTRVRLAGSEEFPLAESTSMSSDLSTLTNSPAARGLRDQYRADLVQLLEDTNQGGVCGIAWLLTSLANTNFNAYSIADVDCAAQYTPTHEMGHNMGSHHAPEDNASAALFPYSFGYKDAARGFRTVMAYACTGTSCPRIPNMSNPGMSHNGGVTGTDAQNNALSINSAAQTVANFRQASATPPGPTPTAPSAPTGLQSRVNATVVTLSWTAAATATSYVLNVGSAPGLANVFAGSVGNITTLAGTVPLGTYFWRIYAVNSAGPSAASAEATFTVGPTTCAAPSAPQAFAHSVLGRQVTLTWASPATGTAPIVFTIEVGSATGLSNLLSAPLGAINAISVQAPSGTFFVRLRAQNACGVSGPSQEQRIVVP